MKGGVVGYRETNEACMCRGGVLVHGCGLVAATLVRCVLVSMSQGRFQPSPGQSACLECAIGEITAVTASQVRGLVMSAGGWLRSLASSPTGAVYLFTFVFCSAQSCSSCQDDEITDVNHTECLSCDGTCLFGSVLASFVEVVV
jgi:hypothetical protein